MGSKEIKLVQCLATIEVALEILEGEGYLIKGQPEEIIKDIKGHITFMKDAAGG